VGNLARVLLASAQVFDDAKFLEEGLRWCDHFASTQRTITSSTGEEAGYWGIGYGCEKFQWYHRGPDGEAACNDGASDLFDGDGWVLVADTGTAVTALALGAQLSPPASPRRAAYVAALQRYAEFVIHGCETPPSGCLKCPPRGTGFVLPSGALGDGFFGLDPAGSGKVKPDLEPYSIATFLTGVAFFAELERIIGVGGVGSSGVDGGGAISSSARARRGNKNKSMAYANYTAIVTAALRWTLGTIATDGHMPDILDGSIEAGTNGSAIPYASEAVIAAQLLVQDASTLLSASRLNLTVRYLCRTQLPGGGWSDDHSPRSLSMLQWYLTYVDPNDAEVLAAIRRFLGWVTRVGWRQIGRENELCCSEPGVWGFLGLALADAILPWSTFCAVGGGGGEQQRLANAASAWSKPALSTATATVIDAVESGQNSAVVVEMLDVYVSPVGDDGASGTSEAHPWQTLERARTGARALLAEGRVPRVNLLGGVYRRNTTFALTARDSGSVWRVAPSAGASSPPVITASVAVKWSSFEPVDENDPRIPAAAKKKVGARNRDLCDTLARSEQNSFVR
jgi:hypothetical protein